MGCGGRRRRDEFRLRAALIHAAPVAVIQGPPGEFPGGPWFIARSPDRSRACCSREGCSPDRSPAGGFPLHAPCAPRPRRGATCRCRTFPWRRTKAGAARPRAPQHKRFVFASPRLKDAPLYRLNNSGWRRARARAAARSRRSRYRAARRLRSCPRARLQHTLGRRLRVAGVGFETRQVLLGHNRNPPRPLTAGPALRAKTAERPAPQSASAYSRVSDLRCCDGSTAAIRVQRPLTGHLSSATRKMRSLQAIGWCSCGEVA